jgi:hypothetical protein
MGWSVRRQHFKLARGANDKEHAMSQTPKTVGIDIGKNSFHVVGHDERGAIVLRQKWSRGQLEARFANMSPCLVGTEACVGTHHLSRKLKALGHDARLMPAKYVRPHGFWLGRHSRPAPRGAPHARIDRLNTDALFARWFALSFTGS